jgi:hypothetical protein
MNAATFFPNEAARFLDSLWTPRLPAHTPEPPHVEGIEVTYLEVEEIELVATE